MAVCIFNGKLIINSIRNAVGVQGKNVANGWSIITKENISVGLISGNLNLTPAITNIIIDTDLIDGATENLIGTNSPTGGSNAELF